MRIAQPVILSEAKDPSISDALDLGRDSRSAWNDNAVKLVEVLRSEEKYAGKHRIHS